MKGAVDRPAPDYCPEKLKPGGCQLHNLHCGYPACNKAPGAVDRPAEPTDKVWIRLMEKADDYANAKVAGGVVAAQKPRSALRDAICAALEPGAMDRPKVSPDLSDERAVRNGARALCKRQSEACNVDEEDNWKTYGQDFIDDARAVLRAASPAGAAPGSPQSVQGDAAIGPSAVEHPPSNTAGADAPPSAEWSCHQCERYATEDNAPDCPWHWGLRNPDGSKR